MLTPLIAGLESRIGSTSMLSCRLTPETAMFSGAGHVSRRQHGDRTTGVTPGWRHWRNLVEARLCDAARSGSAAATAPHQRPCSACTEGARRSLCEPPLREIRSRTSRRCECRRRGASRCRETRRCRSTSASRPLTIGLIGRTNGSNAALCRRARPAPAHLRSRTSTASMMRLRGMPTCRTPSGSPGGPPPRHRCHRLSRTVAPDTAARDSSQGTSLVTRR
jgi:hypothetical protein